MKKVALSLAGLLAIAAFAPEASAVPVFARQTGMACNACHFMHYPLLNAFGRAFKTSGFTMIGAEPKLEDPGMLSIPQYVNAAVLTSMGYEKTSAKRSGYPLNQSAAGASTGGFFVAGFGGEASLFLGGRGSDFMGFLTEVTMGDGLAAVDSFKTPILFDMGGYRLGAVLFTTNGQGASYGFETMNTGANAVHSITNTVGFQNQYINAVSAQQYIGTAQQATGIAFVAAGTSGFVNVTKYAQAGPATGGVFAPITATYARAAYTGSLGSWDAGIGVQMWSGSSLSDGQNIGNPGFVAPDFVATKATAIDGQLQGSIGSMPAGFYFSYATAPVVSDAGVAGNGLNACQADGNLAANCLTRSSLNVDAEIGVVPDKATIGAAVRLGNSGYDEGFVNTGVANGTNAKDNALFLTGTYKLARNLLARLSYVTQSGSYWTMGAPGAVTNADALGKTSTTLNLYALF